MSLTEGNILIINQWLIWPITYLDEGISTFEKHRQIREMLNSPVFDHRSSYIVGNNFILLIHYFIFQFLSFFNERFIESLPPLQTFFLTKRLLFSYQFWEFANFLISDNSWKFKHILLFCSGHAFKTFNCLKLILCLGIRFIKVFSYIFPWYSPSSCPKHL